MHRFEAGAKQLEDYGLELTWNHTRASAMFRNTAVVPLFLLILS